MGAVRQTEKAIADIKLADAQKKLKDFDAVHPKKDRSSLFDRLTEALNGVSKQRGELLKEVEVCEDRLQSLRGSRKLTG